MSREWFTLPINDELQLVQPEVSMGAEVYNLVAQNRDYLNQFLPWAEQIVAPGIEENFIRSMLMAHIQGTQRLFFIAQNDVIIGAVDLHNINQNVRKAEIGYWLSAHVSGQGIMTTVLQFFNAYAFNTLGLNKLMLQVDVANLASNRVAEKCGYQFIGMHPADFIIRGALRDMNHYALLSPQKS